MSSPKLSLVPVTDEDDWDGLVNRSPQGTLLSERLYLKATGRNHHLYWVRQGTGAEIKAGMALIVSDDGRCCELDDLVIYGGLLFNLDPKRQLVKRRHDEFQITEFVVEQIAQTYESIDFQTSPQFDDMRPFLWYRYHEASENRFSLNVRYTSYVDISSLRHFMAREEESPCFNNMETVRRYSVREARRKGGSIARVGSGDTLIEFYRELMHRQGDAQSAGKLSGMKRVIDALLKVGRGSIYEARNSTGAAIYSIFYGWDEKRAYYLFGAGHPEINEPWQGTLAH